jgi:O-antigen/teichoic acid export membrane protein
VAVKKGIMGTGVSDSTVPGGASVGEQQRESHIASGLGGMRKKKNTGYGNVALAALFWSYFRSALAILITIPTAVILARLLTPTEFGIATAARFFAQMAAFLSSGGMGAALIRAKSVSDEHTQSVFAFNALVNVLAFAGVALASPWIGAFYGSDDVTRVMPFVALNFLVVGFFTVPQALLSRDLRYREMSTAGAMDQFVTSVSACTLAFAGFGYWSLVFSDLMGAIVKGSITSYYTRWRPRLRFSRAAFRELLSFGLGSYAARVLHHASLNLDNLVIGRFLGLSALGFYDKGFSVGNQLFRKLTVAGPNVSFRILAIIQDEPERFRRAYRKLILSVTLLGYPFFAMLIGIAYPLFAVAFGETWLPSVVPFQIICVVFMLKLTNQYASAAAQACGGIWWQIASQVATVVMIPAAVYMLTPWGITGAAVGVLFAQMVSWLLMQGVLRSLTPVTWRDIFQPQVPALLCSVGIVVLLAIARTLLARVQPDAPLWTALVVQGGLGGLFYVGFMWFARFPELRSLVDDTLSSISPKLTRLVRRTA